ncbi:hypothetical protein SDC9_185990 [bioreactor metagenome]|uniref:Uncharacterized protein n=1 Tax=bioreactor metagenome TaxID=1076179 RepID=A0A645HIM5_9ZZZZ
MPGQADLVDIDKIETHGVLYDRQQAFRILRVLADRYVGPAVPGKIQRNHHKAAACKLGEIRILHFLRVVPAMRANNAGCRGLSGCVLWAIDREADLRAVVSSEQNIYGSSRGFCICIHLICQVAQRLRVGGYLHLTSAVAHQIGSHHADQQEYGYDHEPHAGGQLLFLLRLHCLLPLFICFLRVCFFECSGLPRHRLTRHAESTR